MLQKNVFGLAKFQLKNAAWKLVSFFCVPGGKTYFLKYMLVFFIKYINAVEKLFYRGKLNGKLPRQKNNKKWCGKKSLEFSSDYCLQSTFKWGFFCSRSSTLVIQNLIFFYTLITHWKNELRWTGEPRGLLFNARACVSTPRCSFCSSIKHLEQNNWF